MPPRPVTVYVLSGCPHCTRAIALLRRRGIEHEVVSGDGVPGFRARLANETGGWTVPQIVVDGRPIGGADQLARLARRGVLRALVDGTPLPLVRTRRRRLRRARSRWAAEVIDGDGRLLLRAAGPDPESALAGLPAELRGQGAA